jgi:shikimate kinase
VPHHIVLVGLMGAGKSTVGRALAARLERAFVDNDTELVRRRGATAAAMVAELGADALHDAEAATARAMLRARPAAVVALAGSAIEDGVVRTELRRHAVVWLRAQPATLTARVRAQGEVPGRARPSDAALETTPAHLHDARAARLAEVARVVVDVDGRPVDAIVEDICARLAGDGALSSPDDRTPGLDPARGCAPS